MRPAFWSASVLALSTALPAVAQERAIVLDPITITSTKRDEIPFDVIGSVSAADAEEFKSRGFQSIDQLDRLFPDTNIRQRSSRAYSNITIRGQSSVDFYNPTAQLLVDGLPQDQTLFAQRLPLGLERVEVLYGPQGTLYGRGAVGGVVSLITRKPDGIRRFEAEGIAASDDLSGQVLANAPLVEDSLFGDLLVHGGRQDGELTELFTGAERGDGDEVGGRLRLRYAPIGSPLDVMVTAAQNRLTSEEEYFVPRANLDDRLVLPVFSRYELETDSFGVIASYDLGFAAVTALSGYQDRKLDRTIFGSYTPETQRTFSQELRLASKPAAGNWLDYVVGVYYQDLDFQRDVPAVSLTSQQDITSYAAFADLTWHATRTIDLSSGVRFDYEEAEVSTRLGGLALANEDDFSSVSPKFGIGYKPTEALRFYALYSSGFKAGGFTRAVTPANIGFSYDPQYSHNFEIGTKARLLDNRLELSAAAYYVFTDDYQLSVGPVQGMYLQNVGEVESKGFDVLATLRPTADLRVTAGFAVNDTYFSDYNNPANPGTDLTGNTVPYAPTYTANLNLEYFIDLADGLGTLVPHVGVTAVGRTYFDEANTVSQSSYALFDAGLSWQVNENLTADLFVDNIADETFAVYGFNAGPPFGDVYQVGTGRVIGARLHARF